MSKQQIDHIIRAWKDREYRESLSAEELARLPENPAGMIELSSLESRGIQGGGRSRFCYTYACTG